MWSGNLKAITVAITLAAASLGLSACGSGDEADPPQKPPIPPATANQLASQSDQVAADLDDGELCTAAGEADDLLAAVQDAQLPANLRSGIESAAQDLVNQVNCPPPPEPEKPEKPEKKEHKDEGHGNEDKGGKPTNSGGFVPPGHAKGQD
jgi:hypothetical protein